MGAHNMRITHPAKMVVPARYLAHGARELFDALFSGRDLPEGVFGVTEDGKPMFSGRLLFTLKATHGVPLDFSIGRIVEDCGFAVDWVEFIETARENLWWDFQTYDALKHAMADAALPEGFRHAVESRFKVYVVQNPHPGLAK